MRRAALVLVMVAACSRADATGAPGATGAPTSSAGSAGSTSAASAGSAAPAVSAASPAASAASWSGKYSATPGSMYVPDGGEWSGVKFRGDDASTGLGEGGLQITVEPSGRAHGTLDGPLGPLQVEGSLGGSELTASLVSTEPNGFTGTLVGHAEGAKIDGTMRLASQSTANVLRVASFSLARGAAK